MRKNLALESLRSGKAVLGAFQGYDSPEITEILGYAGFDFVVLDTEHGGMYPGLLEGHIRAAECGGTEPFVRVPSFQRTDILKALDRGATGILVPMVNTKQDAQRVVEYTRYDPEGRRGLTFSSRAAHYGVGVKQGEHLETSNREILIMVQIETREALANLDEILTVPGVDLIFIGPSDLSQSFGKPGQVADPEVQAAIETILEKAGKANKMTGIFVSTPKGSEKWRKKGVQLLLAGTQGLVAGALSGYAKAVKDVIK